MQTCWELAKNWYKGRLDHDWQRPDQAKVQQLFEKLGLRGSFLDLGRTSWVEKFDTKPIGTVKEDIAAMMAGKRW